MGLIYPLAPDDLVAKISVGRWKKVISFFKKSFKMSVTLTFI